MCFYLANCVKGNPDWLRKSWEQGLFSWGPWLWNSMCSAKPLLWPSSKFRLRLFYSNVPYLTIFPAFSFLLLFLAICPSLSSLRNVALTEALNLPLFWGFILDLYTVLDTVSTLDNGRIDKELQTFTKKVFHRSFQQNRDVASYPSYP